HHITTHVKATQRQGRAIVQLEVTTLFVFGSDEHEGFARHFYFGKSVAVCAGGLDYLLLVVEQFHLYARHRLGRKYAGGDYVYAIVVATLGNEPNVRCQHVAAGPALGSVVSTVARVVSLIPIVIIRV